MAGVRVAVLGWDSGGGCARILGKGGNLLRECGGARGFYLHVKHFSWISSVAVSVSGQLAVGGPLGQRAVGCLCLGPFHFYHRGAVRLSRQRQRGVIEQSGAQGAAPGHKSREAAPAREGASLKGGLGEDRERNALRGCSASADPP